MKFTTALFAILAFLCGQGFAALACGQLLLRVAACAMIF
jgi:hypothetical protein